MSTISKNRNGIVKKTSSINPNATAKKIYSLLISNGYLMCLRSADLGKANSSFTFSRAKSGSCYFEVVNEAKGLAFDVRIANHSKRTMSGSSPDAVCYYLPSRYGGCSIRNEISALNIFDVDSKNEVIDLLEKII